MTWFDLIILVLSVGGILDAWFNGSIFGEWRSFLQMKLDEEPDDWEEETSSASIDASESDEIDEGEPLPFMMRIADRLLPNIAVELLVCSFCLSCSRSLPTHLQSRGQVI
jgi:hypothetical protein